MQMLTEIVIKQPEFTELLAQVGGTLPGSRLGGCPASTGPTSPCPAPGDRVQRRPALRRRNRGTAAAKGSGCLTGQEVRLLAGQGSSSFTTPPPPGSGNTGG